MKTKGFFSTVATLGIGATAVAAGMTLASGAAAAAPVAAAAGFAPLAASIAGDTLKGFGQSLFNRTITQTLDDRWEAIADQAQHAASTQLPRNHDIVRGLRLAHLRALAYCSHRVKERVKARGSFHEGADYDGRAIEAFLKACRKWIVTELNELKSIKGKADADANRERLQTRIGEIQSGLAGVGYVSGLSALSKDYSEATLVELSEALKSVAIPQDFIDEVEGAGDPNAGIAPVALAFFMEVIKRDDDVFRAALLAKLDVIGEQQAKAIVDVAGIVSSVADSVGALGREMSNVWERIEALTKSEAERMRALELGMDALAQGTTGEALATRLNTALAIGTRWTLTAAEVDALRDGLAADLIGEDIRFNAIDKELASGPGVLVVCSPPGGGKTTLLSKWADLPELDETVVVCHFVSQLYQHTTRPDEVLGNLLRQIRQAAGKDGRTSLGQTTEYANELHAELMAWGDNNRRLVVLLDGLDEMAEPLHPFVAGNLPTNVRVVVSARAAPRETPGYLAGWTRLWPRFDVAPLSVSELESWIAREAPSIPNPTETAAIIARITDGLPLFARFLIDDLSAGPLPANTVKIEAGGLTQYVAQAWANVTQDVEAERYLPLLATLAVARGPMRSDELNSLFRSDGSAQAINLQRLPSQVARWLAATGEGDARAFSIAHIRLAETLAGIRNGEGKRGAGVIGEAADDAELALTEWASQHWKEQRTGLRQGLSRAYAVQWAPDHLIDRAAGAADSAIELAYRILLDLDWIEKRTASGRVTDLFPIFSRFTNFLPEQDGRRLLVRSVGEALRLSISEIEDRLSTYPQIINQTVQNRLSVLLDPSNLATPAIPEALATEVQPLLARWAADTAARKRLWVKFSWLAHRIDLDGPRQWQARLRDGKAAYSLEVSPDGSTFAAAAATFGTPSTFSRNAFVVGVFSATDGRLIRYFSPECDDAMLEEPRSVVWPPELEDLVRDYFDHADKQKNAPPVRLNFDIQAVFAEYEQNKEELWEASKKSARRARVGEGWKQSWLTGDIRSLCWINNHTLAAGARGGRVFIWDLGSGSQTGLIQLSNAGPDNELTDWDDFRIESIALIADDVVALGTSHAGVVTYHLEPSGPRCVGAFVFKPAGPDGGDAIVRAIRLAWHAGSSRLAVGLNDQTVRICRQDGREQTVLQVPERGWPRDLSWSPDGARLSMVNEYHTLFVWPWQEEGDAQPTIVRDVVATRWLSLTTLELIHRVETGAVHAYLDLATGKLTAVNELPPIPHSQTGRFANDLVLAPQRGHGVAAYKIDQAGIRIEPAEAHNNAIWLFAMSPDRSIIATGATDGLMLWHAVSGKRFASAPMPSNKQFDVMIDLVRAKAEDELSPEEVASLPQKIRRHASLGARRDLDRRIYTFADDGIRWWPDVDRAEAVRHDTPSWPFSIEHGLMAFGPAGDRLAVAAGRDIWMYRVNEEKLELHWTVCVRDYAPKARFIREMHFVDDGRKLLTDDAGDPTGRNDDDGSGEVLWDVEAGELVVANAFRGGVTYSSEPMPNWNGRARPDRKAGLWSFQVSNGPDLVLASDLREAHKLAEKGAWVVVGPSGRRPSRVDIF